MTRQRSLVLRTIYALCLLGATYNHAVTLFQHGIFWDYGGAPRGSAIFWTMLTILDPAAVILLYTRPNAGVAATVAIITVDVVHNLWIQTDNFPYLLEKLSEYPRLIEQIFFMVFVLITAPLAWWTPEANAIEP